jgi:hypothetical protein
MLLEQRRALAIVEPVGEAERSRVVSRRLGVCTEALSAIACSSREGERRYVIACFDGVPRELRRIRMALAKYTESLTVELRALLDSERVVHRVLGQLVPELDVLSVELEHPTGNALVEAVGASRNFDDNLEVGTVTKRRRSTNDPLRRQRQTRHPREHKVTHRRRHIRCGRRHDLGHEEWVPARRPVHGDRIEANRLRHRIDRVETERRDADLGLHCRGNVAQRST